MTRILNFKNEICDEIIIFSFQTIDDIHKIEETLSAGENVEDNEETQSLVRVSKRCLGLVYRGLKEY